MNRPAGFTLIELVLVMIVISVGLLGLAAAFSNSARSLTTNETLQQATQSAQECAEKAMATRRSLGFSAMPGFTCGNNPDLTPVASVTSYSGTACHTGDSCVQVNINVKPNASLSSAMTLMLVDY